LRASVRGRRERCDILRPSDRSSIAGLRGVTRGLGAPSQSFDDEILDRFVTYEKADDERRQNHADDAANR
jgi:hypothetical protein